MDKVTESKRIRIRDKLNEALGLTYKRKTRWNLIITEDDNGNQILNLFKPDQDLYFYTLEELEEHVKKLIELYGKARETRDSSSKMER